MAGDATAAIAAAIVRHRGSKRGSLDELTARMLVAELQADGVQLVRNRVGGSL